MLIILREEKRISLLCHIIIPTFYEYDEEGNLLRIKKETERGVYTIQDARYNVQKKD